MAVADAGAPEVDGRGLPPQPSRRRHTPAADVVRQAGAGVPGHLGRGGGGHIGVLADCGGDVLHDVSAAAPSASSFGASKKRLRRTDHRLNLGLPPLGFLGPRLYSAMEQHPGVAFEDVTVGNTNTSCGNGFRAAAGWDAATGWGRPIWPGMLQLFGTSK